ncbi:YaaR family protein [Candidatus Epulonipiscium viviparus]|uniref:YaaR family protein n=1 Tax=Candidatus Epulonipiscium viviparus TaxID=420336 RepID=UPI00016C0462|nr:YaaR family protein [Candidatus Epulopiscium viviparus]
MDNIQLNKLQMPTLKELPQTKEPKLDKGFKFTLLSQLEDENLQEQLTKMINKISEQGDKISKHMDIRDIKIYRQMITDFVAEITVRSHKFTRENILDRRGRHRVYGIVRTVNGKLDELAAELIKSEKDQIEILGRIGEIQGLLLDMLT